MPIELTAGQAVTIHGWMRARKTLTWGDVLTNNKATFEFLVDVCHLSPHDLYTLQPDIHSWIRHERVSLKDTPRLTAWSAHPIKDMRADLADIFLMRWSADELKRMGVTFQDLQQIGLSAETMPLMGLTLHGWATIGFSKQDAAEIAPAVLSRIFKVPWFTVIASLP